MTERHDNSHDLELALALRRLDDAVEVPPVDPEREAELMAAFDAARARTTLHRRSRRSYWAMAGLATAATLLIAVGLDPARTGRHGPPPGGNTGLHKPLSSSSRGVPFEPQPPGEFVMVPGAAALPPMESGELVRMELPVSMLPSLGVVPPSSSVARVRADLIVGQDGLTRAVRLVN